MHYLLEYVPGMVAFTAALIGILGKPKWDPAKRGLRRLSWAGYTTLVVAAAAFLVSVLLIDNAQRKADVQRAQRQQIERVAYTELRMAIQKVLRPFFVALYFGTDGDRSSLLVALYHGTGLNRSSTALDLVPLNVDPLDHGHRTTLASTDLNAPYPPSLGRKAESVIRWARAFQRAALRGSEDIDRVLQIYSAYLESDVLVRVSYLRTAGLLRRLTKLDDHVTERVGPFSYKPPEKINPLERPTSDYPARFYYADPGPKNEPKDPSRDWGYDSFWRLVVELDCLLIGDEELLRVSTRGHPRRLGYPGGRLFDSACERMQRLANQQGAPTDTVTSRR